MTTEEVKHIQSLLDQDCSYQKIATLTGISVNTEMPTAVGIRIRSVFPRFLFRFV